MTGLLSAASEPAGVLTAGTLAGSARGGDALPAPACCISERIFEASRRCRSASIVETCDLQG